jgi:hypothetical protein
MVLNEYDAEGPMTSRLLALVALNNMYVLVMYGVVSAGLTLFRRAGSPPPIAPRTPRHRRGKTVPSPLLETADPGFSA